MGVLQRLTHRRPLDGYFLDACPIRGRQAVGAPKQRQKDVICPVVFDDLAPKSSFFLICPPTKSIAVTCGFLIPFRLAF